MMKLCIAAAAGRWKNHYFVCLVSSPFWGDKLALNNLLNIDLEYCVYLTKPTGEKVH